MSQAKAIEDMDFKELRQEVRRLSDKLARMERTYADTLENLDDDNLSAQTLKEKEKMKTDIRHTEEGLEIVTKEVYPDGTDAESAIKINANQIATKVSKTLNFGEALRGTASPELGGDTDKLYFWETSNENKKGYYYYNSVSEEWIRVDCTSIYSAFIQTADGFELHGSVRIDGDLIVENSITADKINVNGLGCEKLYQKGKSNGAYMKINSSFGDFGVYDASADEEAGPTDSACIFGVHVSDAGVINFYSYGVNFMGYNALQGKFYPKKVWDFSSAKVIGLPEGV